jgi:hypothetical protein
MMLDEESIREALEEIVKQLKAGDADQAAEALDELGFERLRRPITDPSQGAHRQFIDPAEASGLGVERVNDVGRSLKRVALLIRDGSTPSAARDAEVALQRWKAGP